MDGQGKRFNEGKIRYDLVPPFAQEQYAKVLTAGSNKYGDRNWERGMKWSKIIASLKRHIEAFERGEDYDPETGLLHMAHAMTNAAFAVEYYKIFPQGDDRVHWYKNRPRIGLDIDEVLADFVGHYNQKMGIEAPVETWNFDTHFKERLGKLANDKDFWLTIPRKIDPKDIPFEPCCYITSRPCDTKWTEEWISKNGFPTVPVITTYNKVEAVKANNVEWFVDDRFENFVELTKNDICCFLWDAPHNQRYDVGFKRLKKFSDLPLFR